MQHEQIYCKGVVPSLSWSTLPASASECRISRCSWNATQRALTGSCLLDSDVLPRSMPPSCGSPVSRSPCGILETKLAELTEAASGDMKAIVAGARASGPVGCTDMLDTDDRTQYNSGTSAISVTEIRAN